MLLQGLEAAGDDLEAVSKFLDVSGSKLDYRRYGVNLIEILIAGGLLGKFRIYFVVFQKNAKFKLFCFYALSQCP